MSTGPYLVDYSDKCIAVFGDTKPLKEKFKEMGGRFNPALNHLNAKASGWIFKIADKEKVSAFLSTHLGEGQTRTLSCTAATTANSNSSSCSSSNSNRSDGIGSRDNLITDANLSTEPEDLDSKSTKASIVTVLSEPITDAPVQLVDYSEKCIAVFGDTKPLKEKFKEMGGRFNPALNHLNAKASGWIFKIADKEKVSAFLSTHLGEGQAIKHNSISGSSIQNVAESETHAAVAKGQITELTPPYIVV